MKKIILQITVLAGLAIGAISCGNNAGENKMHDNWVSDHRKLTEEDSVMEVQHDQMHRDHEEWAKTEANEKSTKSHAEHKIMEEQHMALLAKHDSIVAQHKELTARHAELENQHGEGSVDEKKLEEEHNKIMEEHKKMKEEHDQMVAEHEKIKTEHDEMQADHKSGK